MCVCLPGEREIDFDHIVKHAGPMGFTQERTDVDGGSAALSLFEIRLF